MEYQVLGRRTRGGEESEIYRNRDWHEGGKVGDTEFVKGRHLSRGLLHSSVGPSRRGINYKMHAGLVEPDGAKRVESGGCQVGFGKGRSNSSEVA